MIMHLSEEVSFAPILGEQLIVNVLKRNGKPNLSAKTFSLVLLVINKICIRNVPQNDFKSLCY